VVGTLVVTIPGGKTKTRELAGPECESVAEALAVVMALAIDPDANLDPSASVDPTASVHPGATVEPGDASTATAPPVVVPEAPPPARPRAALQQDRPIPRSARRPSEKPALSFAVQAGAELTSAVVRGVLPVLSASFDTRLRFGPSVPRWLLPSLALG